MAVTSHHVLALVVGVALTTLFFMYTMQRAPPMPPSDDYERKLTDSSPTWLREERQSNLEARQSLLEERQTAFERKLEEKQSTLERKLEDGRQQNAIANVAPQDFGKVLMDGEFCLLGARRERTKQCWSEMKRELWLREISMMEQLQPSAWSKYSDPVRGWEPFDLLPPTYDCDPNNMKRVGDSDGGKWLCEPLQKTNSCVIVSIGSNGNFAFERGMKDFTKGECQIYTFDCTGTWSDYSTYFYPWCIGGKDELKDGKIYKRLSTIMKELNLTHINYLKTDVEGYEWAMIPDILDVFEKNALPHQLSFELHTGAWPWKIDSTLLDTYYEDRNWFLPIVKLGRLIDKAGYRVGINEVNVYCSFCTEIVLVRKEMFT